MRGRGWPAETAQVASLGGIGELLEWLRAAETKGVLAVRRRWRAVGGCAVLVREWCRGKSRGKWFSTSSERQKEMSGGAERRATRRRGGEVPK